jgi:predicted transcriptional regulator
MYDEGREARERRARNHPVRAEILALLADDGCEPTVEQIQAELPGDPTLRNVYYHLRTLEAGRLIVRDGGRYKLS